MYKWLFKLGQESSYSALPCCQPTIIMATFKRLVRFTAGTQTHYGDLISALENKYTVRKLEGSPFTSLRVTEEIFTVEKVGYFSVVYKELRTEKYNYSLNARLKARRSSCASD